jgi:predicted DNA-binding ribbon-helix-helix protein
MPTTYPGCLKADRDFLADSGSFFLKLLRDLGAAPGAPEGLAADWATVTAWLGCAGHELTPQEYEKFGLVFRSYLAQGVAPSVTLEEPFRKFSQMAKVEAWPTIAVPHELVPVLKRMIASDRDIQEKRATDALRFASALKSLNARSSQSVLPAKTPDRRPSEIGLNWIPLGVSIVMLLMASGDDWPYGFYQLLRIVVTGTAVYIVVQTLNHRQYWPWIMAGIAIMKTSAHVVLIRALTSF